VALRPATVPLPRPAKGHHGSHLGLLDLQLNALVRPAPRTASAGRCHVKRRETRTSVRTESDTREGTERIACPSITLAQYSLEFLHTFLSPSVRPHRFPLQQLPARLDRSDAGPLRWIRAS